MRVKRVKAINYRTLENVDIDFKSNYCTLSGHNNAGKSAIIRILSVMLNENRRYPWSLPSSQFSYSEDKTKWVKNDDNVVLCCEMELEAKGDRGLISYIERQTKASFGENDIDLTLTSNLNTRDEVLTALSVNGVEIKHPENIDIIRKLRGLGALLVHNSTRNDDEVFISSGKPAFLYDLTLSSQDLKAVSEAEAKLQKSLKRAAKVQTGELNGMLERLSGSIGVELTSDVSSSRRIPLGVNLTDKNVEVPLGDWGSGTQNKTKVLMSLLQASRLKGDGPGDDRVAPIVVIEEPESFLHPSAQAEFGHVLQALAEEMKLQVIVATHSPFMLNQISPESNILLKRRIHRSKELNSEVIDTTGRDWMVPFAEHLGIIPPEFDAWRSLLTSKGSKVLLVEGDVDKEYIEHLRTNFPKVFPLPADVEIVPYGGKDALKNTTILNFLIAKVEKFYITFDLDACNDVIPGLTRIGLEEGKDYTAVGVNKPGRQAIEGLLPDKIVSSVYGREIDTVLAISSTNSKERNSAKSAVKKLLLAEFKLKDNYDDAELKGLATLGRGIAKAFS